MNQYYLMAQLPSLDAVSDAAPLPVTEERFLELCGRFLGKKALGVLRQLTIAPPRTREATGSRLADAWNDGERNLRLALVQVRTERLAALSRERQRNGTQASGASESAALSHLGAAVEPGGLPADMLQAARTAAGMDNPLAAEQFLNKFRMDFLDGLRPSDPFSEDAVFYYGLKLKLLARMRRFDEQKGRDAYRTIYDAIMRGDKAGG